MAARLLAFPISPLTTSIVVEMRGDATFYSHFVTSSWDYGQENPACHSLDGIQRWGQEWSSSLPPPGRHYST